MFAGCSSLSQELFLDFPTIDKKDFFFLQYDKTSGDDADDDHCFYYPCPTSGDCSLETCIEHVTDLDDREGKDIYTYVREKSYQQ